MTGRPSQRHDLAGELLYPIDARYRHDGIPAADDRRIERDTIGEEDPEEVSYDKDGCERPDDLSPTEMPQYRPILPPRHGHLPARLRRQYGQLHLLRYPRNPHVIPFNVYQQKIGRHIHQ